MENIKLILLFSGKRKSGKDYLTQGLFEKLGPEISEIIRISEPIKQFWAKENDLDINELLSDGQYKEKYRRDMIRWSDKKREENYGYFCNESMKAATKPIIIVSDIRRKTDIKWFFENFEKDKIVTVRVCASNATRLVRGWSFVGGVDDVASEIDLDSYEEWNFKLDNNDEKHISIILKNVYAFVRNKIE